MKETKFKCDRCGFSTNYRSNFTSFEEKIYLRTKIIGY